MNQFNKTLKTNFDDLESFLKQIDNKKIKIQCEFDNEIISQLIEYINSINLDFQTYNNYVKNIESAYKELETEYYKQKENVAALESEDDILHSQLEQQRDIFKNSVRTLSARGGISLDEVDLAQIGVEFEKNEIEDIKKEQMDYELTKINLK